MCNAHEFLPQNWSFPIEVQQEGDTTYPTRITVTTQYARFTSEQKTSASGQIETWSQLHTLPAFEIALLTRSPEGISIVLMRKQRIAGEPFRTKAPGGYLRGPFETYGLQKVHQDTGFSFDPTKVRRLAPVIGHAEIHTPIQLMYTFDHDLVGVGRFETVTLPLEYAVKMACRNELENDSSFHLVMKVAYLEQRGQLI